MGYMINIDMKRYCVEYDELNRILELSNEVVENRKKIVSNLKIANGKLKKEHDSFIQKLKELDYD
jgi:hypothetical protein